MMVGLRVSILLLFFLWRMSSEIYLYNTNDGLNIESYDCVRVQSSLLYCRRPREAISLNRDTETTQCAQNGGDLHRFSELRSKNISVSTVLHQWRSTLERVEGYSRYRRDSSQSDGDLCECLHLGSFGKNCEYQLPVGKTFDETLDWQLMMREKNPQEVQIYGDVVCYETLQCDSGVLCLDWREICDGIQDCLEGRDEANCDFLEMNQCEDDEYRCMNGMCIPDQFFLDGEFDCLDWSDEMPFKKSDSCPGESASTECDDHLCPATLWSCGDGECIRDRLIFQRLRNSVTCQTGRDQYFLCETHFSKRQWTMANGRCYNGDEIKYEFEESSAPNRSEEERCEYFFKCSLSQGGEKGCLCADDPGCVEKLSEVCPLPWIRYPRRAIVAPFLFFLFNHTKNRTSKVPDALLINGTVRCRDALITVRGKIIPFQRVLDARQIVATHFCRPLLHISSSELVQSRHECHQANESTDRCNEWNPCLSITRIEDGWKNCLNGEDEIDQTEMETEKSCARVRNHRFRCADDQPTCLSVTRIGDAQTDCYNRLDFWWFGNDRRLSSLNCHQQMKDECSLLRQYVQQSWTSVFVNQSESTSKDQTSFRSYCDTFWNLPTRDDEHLVECQRSWICPKDRWRCETGQCIELRWLNDGEWYCADASDEHGLIKDITQTTLEAASLYDFTNRSYNIPSSCPQSHSFLCLSSEAMQRGLTCFNLSQIGDGRIDCAGAIDERNTLLHCSRSSMLGTYFRCPLSDICIPFYVHCWKDLRCPNRSDDEHWCSRQQQPSNRSTLNDFTCFDGESAENGRCNGNFDCRFGEDEYMCDALGLFEVSEVPYRERKQFLQRATKNILRLSPYPTDANITQLNLSSLSMAPARKDLSSNISSHSPYWCNRGLGALLTQNHSTIVCFCPPQYYGDKCEYHQDRLLVLLHLDLSSSIFVDQRILLKLLVLFFFNNQLLGIDQFHFHPSFELTPSKLITHFLYPRSSAFLQERQKRLFNRSDLLALHPYSIRIELYQTRTDEQPSLVAVWKYPVFLDYLPVFRLAKVLRFRQFLGSRNPCFTQPCHPNERCQQLMNNHSQYICLCPANFTGENCSIEDTKCGNGYCSTGSLCQPHLGGDSTPFCLCPLNRFGDRCLIEHDACLSNPCLNKGSCLPDSQGDRVICICTKEYLGTHCQWRRPSIHLSLSISRQYQGVVIQYLQIDLISLRLDLVDQQVFRTFPQLIEYFHPDQKTILPDIVLAKLYSSHEDLSPDIYLLSVNLDLKIFSLDGRAQVSLFNRCSHLRTFSNGNFDSSRCFFKCFDLFRSYDRFFTNSISSDLHP